MKALQYNYKDYCLEIDRGGVCSFQRWHKRYGFERVDKEEIPVKIRLYLEGLIRGWELYHNYKSQSKKIRSGEV